MSFKYISFPLLLLLINSIIITGQTTIGIQDFDGATPTMTYTGGNVASGNGSFPNTSKFVSSANGRQIRNSTSDIVFSTVNSSAYSSINFKVRLASFSGSSGNGADGGDYAIISISTNSGSTWSQELKISGNSNARWGFTGTNAGSGTASIVYDGDNVTSNFAPTGSGYRGADGYTNLEITGLPAITTLRVKMEFKNNSNNEYWIIDDAKIEGTVAGCNITASGISNLTCNDNGTLPLDTDDFLTFDLNPTGGSLGATYTVSVAGGGASTITPASASYGSATSFTLNGGTAGGGDITLTITDVTGGGCNLVETITDPGSCSSSCNTYFSDDFSGTLAQWSNNGDWAINSGEMKHNLSGVGGSSYNSADIGLQDLTAGDYEWNFCMRNGNFDPSGGNHFTFWVISDIANLQGAANGYCVGVNQTGSSDELMLYKVTAGVYTSILTIPSGTFNWSNNDDICIRVTRTSTGDWELFYNDNGAGEVSGGTITDATFTSGQYAGTEFTFTSSRAGLFFIDDIDFCNGVTVCVPTHSITSFAPTEGPELTEVTITGTGFTNSSTATIDGTAATATFVDATTIIVEIPIGVSSNTIIITENSCTVETASTFSLLDETGSCGTTFSDLIISEVYDQTSGSLGYIEIYNGTGVSINLSTYKIKRYGTLVSTSANPIYTFPASGIGSSISNGQVLVGRIGSGGSTAIYDFIYVNSNSGYNADDRLELYDGATFIDDWHDDAVGVPGYTYKRNTSIAGPNTTYTPAEWTSTATESTADLGTYAIAAGSPPNITTQPNDITSCTIEMDVTATPGNSGILTYQWLYNDGASAGWSNVTAAAFPSTTVSGETTASLSITGTPSQVAAFDGYQFYCIVTEDGTCNKAARAAQFDARESSDPFLLSAMINACVPMTGGSCNNEGDNEFLLIQSGGVDVVVNTTNIILKHGTTSPASVTYTDTFVADATATSNLNNVNTTNGCGTTLFLDAVTTGTIPANSKILLLNPNICVDAYDFSNLCSQGPIYLLFSTDASWGTVGNFTNTGAALRYFELSLTDINGKTTTTNYDYLPNSLSNNDGDYAEFSYCEGSAYSYSNDGCAPLKNILPVEFLNFTATKQKDIVRLDWTTASEINSDYFEVLKSTDGENFTIIETVKAAGNSSVNIDYLSYDYSPSSGNNYYSIHEVDFDNSITDTPVRIINFGKESTVFVSNSESRMLISYKDLSENSTLEIFTIEGKLIYYTNLTQPTGNIMFDAKKNQHYLVRIISNTSVQTIKYIH